MRTSKTNLSVIDNTGARVQPRIVVGENAGAGYKSGDILDANAVINEIPDVDNIVDTIHQLEQTVTALQNTIHDLFPRIVLVNDVTVEEEQQWLLGRTKLMPQSGRTTFEPFNLQEYDDVFQDVKNGRTVIVRFYNSDGSKNLSALLLQITEYKDEHDPVLWFNDGEATIDITKPEH